MKKLTGAHIFTGIIAIAGLFFLIRSVGEILSSPPPRTITLPEAGVMPASTSSTASTSAKETAPKAKPQITYSQALMLYKDARMQFGPACQANPTRMAVKNGAKIMLDNRASTTRTIVIGGERHSLAPFGFSIITIYSNFLPANLSIDCPPAENIALIIVNK